MMTQTAWFIGTTPAGIAWYYYGNDEVEHKAMTERFMQVCWIQQRVK
jgi:hypothetical protein